MLGEEIDEIGQRHRQRDLGLGQAAQRAGERAGGPGRGPAEDGAADEIAQEVQDGARRPSPCSPSSNSISRP